MVVMPTATCFALQGHPDKAKAELGFEMKIASVALNPLVDTNMVMEVGGLDKNFKVCTNAFCTAMYRTGGLDMRGGDASMLRFCISGQKGCLCV